MATLPKPPYQNKVTDSQGYMDRGWLAYFTGMANSLISGWVSSITGAANRIRISGTPAAPIVDIDPAYDGNFIRKVPDSTNSNTIQPTNPSHVPIILKGAVSQIGDFIEILDAAGNVLARIDAGGNVYAGANLIFTGIDPVIRANTADEADTNRLMLSGGGDIGSTRGAYIQLLGNEFNEVPDNNGNAVIAAGFGHTVGGEPVGGEIFLVPGNGPRVEIQRDGSVVFGANAYVNGILYLLNLAGSLNLNGSLTISSFLTASGPLSGSAGLFRTSALPVNGSATDRGHGIFGTSGGFQVQIDNDEIQAMNNNSPTSLNINVRGGNTTIGKDSTTSLNIRNQTSLGGALALAQNVYTSATTLGGQDGTVLANASGGSFPINLPAISGVSAGTWYPIFKTDTTTNTVTVTANGADTIGGAAAIVLGGNGGVSCLSIFADATNSTWRIEKLYEEGTYPATLTGCTTSPTATVFYVRNGKTVTVKMAATLTAISNTTACTLTGAPAHLFPTTALSVTPSLVNDNGLNHPGQIDISTAGVWMLSFYSTLTNLTSTFTNSGNKGLGATSFSYTLQ